MKNIVLLTIIASLLFSGCAAILNGGNPMVRIQSDPTGASIYDNGAFVGRSPLTVKLNKKKDHLIEFRKEGYDTMSQPITTSVDASWIFMDILMPQQTRGPVWTAMLSLP